MLGSVSRVGITSSLAIIAVSAFLGVWVDQIAPGVNRYAQDRLMSARGNLPVPEDIVIVAIDDRSVERFGLLPWRRSPTAQVIDAVAAGEPKAIALDILLAEQSTTREDRALADSISRAGNVVLAAQLVEPQVPGEYARMLLPLPRIRRRAAAIGHVNVISEAEGVARELLVRAADREGRSHRAISLETVRIGEGIPEADVVEGQRELRLGRWKIPVKPVALRSSARTDGGETGRSVTALPAVRMAIDYIGPAGSFSPRTYSAQAVLEGHVPRQAFRERYVIIGATAACASERVPSPFVHQDRPDRQVATLMPAVEVLANSLNTVLRSRFYKHLPEWLAFCCAAMAAGLTLLLLGATEGRHALVRQVFAVASMPSGIGLASYVAFSRYLVIPPVTPAVVAFVSAAFLGLLWRILRTSLRLEASIAQFSAAGDLLTSYTAPNDPAEAIAKLTKAAGVAVLSPRGLGRYALVSHSGAPLAPGAHEGGTPGITGNLPHPSVFELPDEPGSCWRVAERHIEPNGGLLWIAHKAGHLLSEEALQVSEAIAAYCIGAAEMGDQDAEWKLPRGLEDQARMLGHLNARMLERTRFVDLALRSVEDGLIIAGTDGRITFANRNAAEILRSDERSLIGTGMLDWLAECDASAPLPALEILQQLLLDRVAVEREINAPGPRRRQYVLRLSAVFGDEGPAIGLVASLSDITRHKELQRMKDDVIALVSHELRTPLAAIQGISEMLANFDMDYPRRRELSAAINQEVKRLSRMTGEYLDIARLESGGPVLRRSNTHVVAVVERTLRVLEPLARERGILLKRKFARRIPRVLADADLLARAVTNLASNAIKYSPSGTVVTVSVDSNGDAVSIDVSDQGYGIPAEDLERIFDKFVRLPRLGAKGAGLGLALVREIAGLHGGSVSVRSKVGAGSTFTLALPLTTD